MANYSRQLNGCIAVGDLHQDLDRDGLLDLRNSRITLDRIHGHTQGLTQSSLIVYGDGRDS